MSQTLKTKTFRQSKISAVIVFLGILLVAYCFYYITFMPRKGEARDISALRKVYVKAGADYESFFKLSLLSEVKFLDPISWKRWPNRVSAVSITGRVDVVSFKSAVSDHLLNSHQIREQDPTFWFKHYYRFEDQVLVSNGSINVENGDFGLISHQSERKVSENEWRNLTNDMELGTDFGI